MNGILFDKDIRIEKRETASPEKGITGLVVGKNTYQQQRAILTSHPGEFKNSPKTGVGINNFLDDDSPEALFREIRTQFVTDGMKVKKVELDPAGNLKIEADYEV